MNKVSNKDLELFFSQTNLFAVIDHSGRAGNGFFLTLFDQHPEVITCPWFHYTYSYCLDLFGTEKHLDANKASQLWTQESYFKFLYQEPTAELKHLIYRFGGEPETPLNRELIRKIFDEFIMSREKVTRRELILISYFAYAKACGRDCQKIKYVLLSDAVSRKHEDVIQGFSGTVIDHMIADFPKPKLVSLVRDPRATFASNRHQYINFNDNMYGIKFGNTFKRLKELIHHNFHTKNCVYLYWLFYLMNSAKAIRQKIKQYSSFFKVVKNEDLNLHSQKTLTDLTQWLDVNFHSIWNDPDYSPTMVGAQWKGTGAYNNRYQQVHDGPLENDQEKVSQEAAKPNRYVTQRWKKRLAPHEIRLLEYLFKDEMRDLDYDPLHSDSLNFDIHLEISQPFHGEIPKWSWIKKGQQKSPKELLNRVYYLIVLIPFYILSRCILLKFIKKKNFFHLH